MIPKRSLKLQSKGRSKRNLGEIPSIISGKITAWYMYSGRLRLRQHTHKKNNSCLARFCSCSKSVLQHLVTEGKQLRFDLWREILLLLRQVRTKGVGVFLRGHPALDEVARELATVHPDLFASLSKKSAGDRLLEQHRKRENWSRKQSGTNEQSYTSNTGLFLQLIKAN